MFGGNILMKTIFRIATLALMIAAFGAVAAFAQDAAATCTFEMQQKLYGDFRTKTKSSVIAEIEAGIKAGEEFLAKCATPDQQAVVDYLKKNVPLQIERVEKMKLYERFNTSVKTGNVDEAYTSGKLINTKDPDSAFDVAIVLALMGFDNSVKNPPIDKYNNEAIGFAKRVLSEVNSKTSTSYGALNQSLIIKTNNAVDHAKSKNNVNARMNYIIGSIMYFNQKQEKEALPFFYKATQIDSDVKKRPDIYQAIGSWYLKEIVRLDKERLEKIKAAGDKDTDETLAILAMEKGLAERGMNAFGKAHMLADPKQADYVKFLKEKLQGLYEVRFGKQDGFDAYVNTVSAQPLVDPMTPVTPIVEAPTTTTTTTSSTTTPTTNPTTKPVNSPTNTKPTTTPVSTPTTTKPSTTTPVKPTSTTKPTTKSKAVVNKKKSIR